MSRWIEDQEIDLSTQYGNGSDPIIVSLGDLDKIGVVHEQASLLHFQQQTLTFAIASGRLLRKAELLRNNLSGLRQKVSLKNFAMLSRTPCVSKAMGYYLCTRSQSTDYRDSGLHDASFTASTCLETATLVHQALVVGLRCYIT